MRSQRYKKKQLANETISCKKKIQVLYSILKIFVFLHPHLSDGALAQLARAFDWQSRGREFDSHTLHKTLDHPINQQLNG